MGISRLSVNPRLALGGLLVFLGYYAGAQIGFALKFESRAISVLWPPNFILLGALLLFPYRAWPFLIACVLPAHFAVQIPAGVPFGMAAGWFVTNVSEALLGALGTRLLAGHSSRFNRVRTMGAFFLCAVIAAPLLSAFLDAGAVVLNGFRETFWSVWAQRVWSNIFSSAVVTPVIVTWGAVHLRISCITKARVAESAFVAVGLALTSALAFYWQTPGRQTHGALLYAPMPFLVWTAVRFGQRGTSLAVLWVALLAIWGAIHNHGPFSVDQPEQNTHSIQVFFTMLAGTLMFLATSIAQRQQAEERFAKAFDSSPDAIIMTRVRDGRVLAVNDQWEKLLGYSKEETLGRTVLDLHIYPSPEDRKNLVVRTSITGQLKDWEATFRTKTGD